MSSTARANGVPGLSGPLQRQGRDPGAIGATMLAKCSLRPACDAVAANQFADRRHDAGLR
jgi:hypothetical protein